MNEITKNHSSAARLTKILEFDYSPLCLFSTVWNEKVTRFLSKLYVCTINNSYGDLSLRDTEPSLESLGTCMLTVNYGY